MLTGSFMDYPMPHPTLMRAIRCDEHPVPTKANALAPRRGRVGDFGALARPMNGAEAVRPWETPTSTCRWTPPTDCGGRCETAEQKQRNGCHSRETGEASFEKPRGSRDSKLHRVAQMRITAFDPIRH